MKKVPKGADAKIYAVFTGEFEIDGDLGYYGNVVWKSPAMIVAFDAEGEATKHQLENRDHQSHSGPKSSTSSQFLSPLFSSHRSPRIQYLFPYEVILYHLV